MNKSDADVRKRALHFFFTQAVILFLIAFFNPETVFKYVMGASDTPPFIETLNVLFKYVFPIVFVTASISYVLSAALLDAREIFYKKGYKGFRFIGGFVLVMMAVFINFKCGYLWLGAVAVVSVSAALLITGIKFKRWVRPSASL